MKNIRNQKQIQIMIFVFVAIITLGVGYATISAINLVINGSANASGDNSNFSVVFKTASIPEGYGSATITNNTEATINVTGLTAQGESVTATYTIKNESNGVGASIGLKIENSNSDYFQVTESVTDDKLQAGEDTTATITVEMKKTPIEDNVSTSITGTLIATPLDNESAVGGTSAVAIPVPDPVSFSTDSWATIKKAVQDNNTSLYNLGDTKTVEINNTSYTVRLVNKTTGEHCGDNDTEYSQTACGFVVEFAEVVETRTMNSTATNVGGWPATEMRTYLNGTFFNSLPSALQSAIKPTRVISGYGSNDSANFTTTDNLFLLSGVEIYGADEYDTSAGATHQLEYYLGMAGETVDCNWYPGCTTTQYTKAIKQYNGSEAWYLLRSAYSHANVYFLCVLEGGLLTYSGATGRDYGVAPAFRIG